VLDRTRVTSRSGIVQETGEGGEAMTIVEVVRVAEEIRATFGVLLAVKGGEGEVGFVERRCDDSEAIERPRHPESVPNPPLYYLDGAKIPPYSYHDGAIFKVSGTEQFATPQGEQDRNRSYKAVAREARGHFMGPINPAWFIRHHLNIHEKIDSQTHS